MSFWKCYYHIVFATKHRQPIIEASFEPIIHETIQQKSNRFGSYIHAMNGVEDHLHICVSIPPKMAVAKWIGEVKGASARSINTSFDRDEKFYWQNGYGVLSFGEKHLSFVVDYIRQQKQHHANQKTIHRLERTDE